MDAVLGWSAVVAAHDDRMGTDLARNRLLRDVILEAAEDRLVPRLDTRAVEL